MEIKAWKFFSFWVTVSLISMKLGFNALDRTNLSNSVSPVVLFFLKHALAISVCHSSHYNFVYRIRNDKDMLMKFLQLLPLFMYNASTSGYRFAFVFYLIYGFLNSLLLAFDPILITLFENDNSYLIDHTVKVTMLALGEGRKFVPILVILVSIYTAAVWNGVREQELLPQSVQQNDRTVKHGRLIGFGVRVIGSILFVTENSSLVKRVMHTRRSVVEFAIGMVGTILFQYFFKLTTFDHVLAFLYFAVAWLGNLALLQGHDLGVFNFLLGNVIVGCTVNQFGLRRQTWIAYGASIFLYGIRMELGSLSMEDRGREEGRVIVC